MNKLIALAKRFGLAFVAMMVVGLSIPVHAGPVEDAFAAANNYLGNKYDVPDFGLDPSEFGSNNSVILFHLTAEIIVEKVNGGVVVYTPADPGDPGSPMVAAVFVYGGSGYDLPDQTETTMAQCGPGHWFIQNVGGEIWCTPASQVGNEGGYSLVSPEIPAVSPISPTNRSCTYETNGLGPLSHGHVC